MPTTLAAAALAILHSLSPLSAPRVTLPGWSETETERGARYLSIAADVAAAVEEACEGRGDGCKRWGVTVLTGIGTHESGWAPDVDAGRCYRGKDGLGLRCDSGRAWTVWQLLGSAEEGAAWAADRKQAAREALRRASRSWNACRTAEPALRWAVFARGKCTDPEGQRLSRELDALIQAAQRAWPMVK